ncbi:argininosuccinate synthase [candidate division KSB1 bacterium]|nr:argininosuccinate synthase [candidate division KSB1 bacterium]
MNTSLQESDDLFVIAVASEAHVKYAEQISRMLEESAKARGIGIAKRPPEYIAQKMREGKAVIAFHRDGRLAGYSYIETWMHGRYVANSGLIVDPEFRNYGIGKRIKHTIFELSRKKFPNAKIFSITTSHAVMKMNTELGFKPVPFSELPADDEFWQGCSTCKNFDILSRNNRKYCLCTGLQFDPHAERAAAIMKRENRLVVLAFSGGLDTAYCAKFLSTDLELEVHSVVVNTGGFTASELAEIEATAYRLGVKQHVVLDETANYYAKCIKYLIFGNVLKNNTYPLSASAERVFQATALAQYARAIKAGSIAHGSTGLDNDQVRFDIAFNILIPEATILAPIRDHHVSRNQEIEYLKKHGVEYDWTRAQYSLNKGLWGATIGGRETFTSSEWLPEEAFPTRFNAGAPQTVELHFKQGELFGINDALFDDPVQAIQYLEKIAGPYAIGRDLHVDDTTIGIKDRIGFEAAAPLIIIKAHHALEKHALTKWQLYWKDQLANWYGTMLHEGQYLDPVMRNIESFLENAQQNVSGMVSVHLAPYRFQILGVTSPHDLMSPEFSAYNEASHSWTAEDTRGFAKMLANPYTIYYKVNKPNADI